MRYFGGYCLERVSKGINGINWEVVKGFFGFCVSWVVDFINLLFRSGTS